MDIKEIALKVADSLRNKVDGISHMQSNQGLVRFAEAFIESYKADLLNEVGEPVGYHYLPNNEMFPVEEVSRSNLKNSPQDYVFLYTSDQLAAAIAKVTKPLAEEIQRLQDEDNVPVRYYQPNGKGPVYAVYGSSSIDFVEELRNQITVLQEELRSRDDFIEMLQETQNNQPAATQEEISGLLTRLREMTEYANKRNDQALDLQDQLAKAEQLWQIAQGRCDGLEEKLAKAEQRVAEWQPIDTAPKDGTRVLLCIDHGEWGDKVWTGLWGDGWMVSYGKARTEPTHWIPLPKAPDGASS